MELSTILWVSALAFVLALVILFVRKRGKKISNRSILTWHGATHRFYHLDTPTKPSFSNITGLLLSDALICEYCGLHVADDKNEVKLANKGLPCKPKGFLVNDRKSNDELYHHWRHGNLPLNSHCYVCGDICGDSPCLNDWICSWCEICVHEICKTNANCFCKMDQSSKFKFLIPPTLITLVPIKTGLRKAMKIQYVYEIATVHVWQPLLVITNSKSGGKLGEIVCRIFRHHLNPLQVFDIGECDPRVPLQWCSLLPHTKLHIIIAAGDGTMTWVLDTFQILKDEHLNQNGFPLAEPQFTMLPLGTGNDLSRSLGWFEDFNDLSDLDFAAFLSKLDGCKSSLLDRWHLHTIANGGKRRRSEKHITFQNYFSVGVDAAVTLNFHRQRKSSPWAFTHNFINRLWYFKFGTSQVFEPQCPNLGAKLSLFLDHKEVQLPSNLQGIVFCNIKFWGGGCNLKDSFPSSASIRDGKLEVFGLTSSFHIAQIQVSLSQPLYFGQASHIELRLANSSPKKRVPVQADGEPWLVSAPMTFLVDQTSLDKSINVSVLSAE